ncbi:MAG: serine hydrolase [Rhodospirillales bacterium]|nr:serine hydrolase [Rhodospirillales bacterium]
MAVNRRGLAALGAAAVLAPKMALAATRRDPVDRAMAAFAALPATASALLVAQSGNAGWDVAHQPEARLFVGSAVKTFILAEALRQVEAGTLSEDAQRPIDDRVRSLASPVFAHLSGTTPLRSVLEAMIAHSDNTATDAAIAACGVETVRALIASAGLHRTQIPNSTRQLFAYLAGAGLGVDPGWAGMEAIMRGKHFGPSRPPLNPDETMASTAREMVDWYRASLTGKYFTRPETLAEYRRILGMGDAIAQVVPAGLAAYAKGGSIDWDGFYCFAFAGRMVVGAATADCCFTINWHGKPDSVGPMFQAYRKAVADVLAATRTALL